MQIDYLFHNFGGRGLEIYLFVLSHSNAAILGQGRDAKHNQTEKCCGGSFPKIFKHGTPFCSGALKIFWAVLTLRFSAWTMPPLGCGYIRFISLYKPHPAFYFATFKIDYYF